MSIDIQRDELTLELGQEDVDDLVLLDGHGEEVDFLDRANFAILYQTTELGDGHPLLLFILASSATSTSSWSAKSSFEHCTHAITFHATDPPRPRPCTAVSNYPGN